MTDKYHYDWEVLENNILVRKGSEIASNWFVAEHLAVTYAFNSELLKYEFRQLGEPQILYPLGYSVSWVWETPTKTIELRIKLPRSL